MEPYYQRKSAQDLRSDAENFITSVVEWARDNLSPETIWGDAFMEQWAKDNGYTKPEE